MLGRVSQLWKGCGIATLAAFVAWCALALPLGAEENAGNDTADEERDDRVAVAASPPPSGEPSATRTQPVQRIDFLAPFSLNDCQNLLNRALEIIPRSEEELERFDRESYLQMLNAVADYLKDRDDLHSSLVGYQWERLRSRVVREPIIQNASFTFERPDEARAVNAISFSVYDEDAILHGWAVYDKEDKLIDRKQFGEGEKVTLRHSLPRQVVYHLWQPTDIGRIEVAVSRANPQRERIPVLEVRAGRTNQPEHGKSAIWFITQAISDVENERFESAREDLIAAQREIRLYRNTLRVRR